MSTQPDLPADGSVLDVALRLRDPAKWAAAQIVRGGRPNMTVGEASDMIERIVRDAIDAARQNEQDGRTQHDPFAGLRARAQVNWLSEARSLRSAGKSSRFPVGQRAYAAVIKHGLTDTLVSDMDDRELLSLDGIGPETLRELRKLCPRRAQ